MKIMAIVAAAALSGTLTGCSFSERVCFEDEYPVLFLESGQLVGGACVPQGQEPPPGYVRYPKDLEPTRLKDQQAATNAFQDRLDHQG